jgi:hypothetical protein
MVNSVVLGVTATHESGKSAYWDERISVPAQDLAEFEAGSEAWIEGQLGSKGIYLDLQTTIANQLAAPVAAPEDRDKPDFSSMTIGDGYRDLPSEESSEEPAEESSEESSSEESSEDSSEESSEESGGE